MDKIAHEDNSLRTMTVADFASFGVPVVAYVKRVNVEGHAAYAVHNADGTPIGIEDSMDLAALAARHKNLFPVLVQ